MLLSALNALIVILAFRAAEESFLQLLTAIAVLAGAGKCHSWSRPVGQSYFNVEHLQLSGIINIVCMHGGYSDFWQ